MAHIPDERFKNTLYDVEDCLDAITDFDESGFMKESEKKKAIKLFRLFLDFCMDEAIISEYDLAPLHYKIGLEIKNYGQVEAAPRLAYPQEPED